MQARVVSWPADGTPLAHDIAVCAVRRDVGSNIILAAWGRKTPAAFEYAGAFTDAVQETQVGVQVLLSF
jgi:hypothetical protein